MISRFIISFCFISFLTFTTNGQVTLDDSNLPIIIINTNGQSIPNDIKATVDMGIIYNGDGVRNYLTDNWNEYNGKIGIEYRGSSSLGIFPKKGFAIETRDDNGDNNNVKLLGMPEENDWVLNGPYSDKTLIRNALAYKMADAIMDYAPRFRFCELIINDEYQGVYLLLEKIKQDEDRVNISKLNSDEITGDDLTGGYILKIDKTNGEEVDGWFSDFGPSLGGSGLKKTFIQYHYPKPSEIAPEQKNYIKNIVDNFEQVLAAENFRDLNMGYHPLVDVNTFVDFFIVNEITRNVDGYRLSTYFYKDKDSEDGRIKMGPVWDFNLGFGNANYCDGSEYYGWAFGFNTVCSDDSFQIPFWWNRMIQDTIFTQTLVDRWQSLRQSTLSDENMMVCIDSMTNLLQEAQVRNFEQWPILGDWIWPNYYVGEDYNQDIIFLEEWIIDRLKWLDGAIPQLHQNNFSVINESTEIVVFPNPFQEKTTLDFYARVNAKYRWLIFDARGSLVENFNGVVPNNGNYQLEWNGNATSGIYFGFFYINDELLKFEKIIKM